MEVERRSWPWRGGGRGAIASRSDLGRENNQHRGSSTLSPLPLSAPPPHLSLPQPTTKPPLTSAQWNQLIIENAKQKLPCASWRALCPAPAFPRPVCHCWTCSSACLPACLPMFLYIYPPAHVCLPACLRVCVFHLICLPVSPCVCPSVSACLLFPPSPFPQSHPPRLQKPIKSPFLYLR